MDPEKAGVRKRKRKPKESAGVRKRNRGGGGGEPRQDKAVAVAAVVGKVAECVQEEEDYEGITEESVADMMRWLALELAPPAAGDLTAAGISPSVAPAAGAGYVTVQGNVESCGPSFSGSASTVMASVDVRFVTPVPPVVLWPWPEAAPGPREEETVDDEWVAGLLTDGPAEEVGWQQCAGL